MQGSSVRGRQRISGQAAVPGGAAASFDESRFAPAVPLRESYLRAVARGYERMRSLSVVVAGLARNVAPVLPVTIARVSRLASLFGDFRIVIYENDSTDATRPLLQAWAAREPRVTLVSETRDDPVNLPSRCLSRAARMAYYRGQCQQQIASRYAQFDHVILVDTDLEGGWSYDGIAHTFGQDGWDFVGANGIIYRRRWLDPNQISHYDAWAFRADAEFTPLSTKQVNRLIYHRGEPLQRVTSCFGGLGVYRMEAYLAGRYDGADVEHVTFHQELYRRGLDRIYLNPSMIAVYGRKHRSLDPWAARLIRWIDLLPIRRATVWQFAADHGAEVPLPQRDHGRHAA